MKLKFHNQRVMKYKDLKSEQIIHEIGINYVRNFIVSAGFAIHEVREDLNSPFQLFARISERALLIAVRTACRSNAGTIDNKTRAKLVEESGRLNAVPHFAGLSLMPTNVDEYEIFFNGTAVVR